MPVPTNGPGIGVTLDQGFLKTVSDHVEEIGA